MYYCTYEENDKKIKLHSLSYNEDTKGITSSDSDLFDADGETDALTNLNTRYFDQNTEEIKDTLTKEETQKAIAKFMTLNIDKSQNHWDEAKTEIQKDDFYRNEDFD
ncbi:hypothetical protein IJM86_02925 [bacterium]|nr:hypothetical protein [bacterium]